MGNGNSRKKLLFESDGLGSPNDDLPYGPIDDDIFYNFADANDPMLLNDDDGVTPWYFNQLHPALSEDQNTFSVISNKNDFNEYLYDNANYGIKDSYYLANLNTQALIDLNSKFTSMGFRGISGFNLVGLDDTTNGQYHLLFSSIDLNYKYFAKVPTSFSSGFYYRNQWFTVSHPYSVSTHEFGHHIDISLGKTFQPKSRIGITQYGNKNREEAFAEAFVAYTMGATKTRVGNDYYQEFRKYMSDSALDFFDGYFLKNPINLLQSDKPSSR